jgi:hypothetical protein
VLVWWGNHHHAKLIGDDWVPMAMRLQDLGGSEPFCIDQLPTVESGPFAVASKRCRSPMSCATPS